VGQDVYSTGSPDRCRCLRRRRWTGLHVAPRAGEQPLRESVRVGRCGVYIVDGAFLYCHTVCGWVGDIALLVRMRICV